MNNLLEWFRTNMIEYIKVFNTKYSAAVLKLTGYSKPVNTSALAEADTINEALGKLEKGIETASGVKSDWNAPAGDDAEILNKPDLSTKADLVGGKVPTSQLPDSVIGGLEYKGVWDATTAEPAHDENGWYYKVSVAGSTDLNGIIDWKVGDWAVWSDSDNWAKVDNTQEPVSGDEIVAPFTAVTSTQANTDWDNA